MKHFVGGFCVGFPLAFYWACDAYSNRKTTASEVFHVMLFSSICGVLLGGACWGLLP